MTAHKKMGTKQNPNEAAPVFLMELGPKSPSQAVQNKTNGDHNWPQKKDDQTKSKPRSARYPKKTEWHTCLATKKRTVHFQKMI